MYLPSRLFVTHTGVTSGAGIVVFAAAQAEESPHGTELLSLRERLAAGGFAVTAEISPPRGASTDPITATAALLRDWVDAVNVTDNQGSNVRLASWAGSLA